MADDFPLRDHQAWLGYLQPDGLVVSPAALVDAQAILDRNTLPLQERYKSFVQEVELKPDEPAAVIAGFPAFARDFLGWPDDHVHAADTPRPIPDALTVALPEFDETLAPTFAFRDPKPKDPAVPWILVGQVLPAGTNLDAVSTAEQAKWSASPTRRFERLLREIKVPIGLLVNGVSIRLVYAPRGENSGSLTFPVQAMSEVAGRPILAALDLLLNRDRLLVVPTAARLPALLEKSREYQGRVSTALAGQVLDALYDLLRGFQAANDRARGALLRDVLAKNPNDVYAGLLNTLMRLVFLLFSEDRGLMPSGKPYLPYYSIHDLFLRLRDDHEHYPDTMDSRYGAWAQLLAVFRAVHHGCNHPQMKMPARQGYLFDPERYPFLEGRGAGSVPLVPDGVVFRVLRNLLLLDGERLSYRTLDVEQIGSVYETMMGFRLETASGPSVAIKPAKAHGAPTAINLEELLAAKSADRPKWLAAHAGHDVAGATAETLKAAKTVDDLLAALDRKIARNATPGPVPRGALVLQPSDERRKSGSHYTPRSLTEPIVRKTLEPILQRMGEKPTPEQILDLKVCDPAVGSGAFLVEACRQLGDELVRAWHAHKKLPPIPPDEDEILLARRLVAQRCLYGVDRNPMAVDLAKLSLWLATLAKDHPFTFLDHSLRCGDSLVGLTRRQIADFHWEPTNQRVLGQEHIEARINAVTACRKQILEGGDDLAPEVKRQKLAVAEENLGLVRFAGDLVIAAFFGADKDNTRSALCDDLSQQLADYLRTGDICRRPGKPVEEIRSGRFSVTPFHWEAEFPEVFDRENPGFDVIVGNPPFLGGTKVSTQFGEAYRDWLPMIHNESHGNADLVAHFFRRGFKHVRKGGGVGLIATKTIGQGDTRSTGLRWICTNGGTIYSARRRYKWPGVAAVTVSVVHIFKGSVPGPYELDARSVSAVTAYLFHAGGNENPALLTANARRSFKGVVPLGMGFTFDDRDEKGIANKLSEMDRVIKLDQRNKDRILPYIGGEEVNEDPRHMHHRYIINFSDWPLHREHLGVLWSKANASDRRTMLQAGIAPLDYPDPVAADYPNLLQIIESRVKPIRMQDKRESRKKYWWRYGEHAPALFATIAGNKHVTVCPQTSKYLAFIRLPVGVVYDQTLIVFSIESFGGVCVLSSRVHEMWALFFGATLEDRPRYGADDCFETFPFPAGYEKNGALEAAGREYYEFRAALMVRKNEGLTKTYNRFHKPEETSSDIQKLREMHTAMDREVLDAYGWKDIPTDCEFILDYEDEADGEDTGWRRKKPWRYRWPDAVRDEVLARLLALNAQRAEEERLAGLAAAAAKPPGRARRKPAAPAQESDLFGS